MVILPIFYKLGKLLLHSRNIVSAIDHRVRTQIIELNDLIAE